MTYPETQQNESSLKKGRYLITGAFAVNILFMLFSWFASTNIALYYGLNSLFIIIMMALGGYFLKRQSNPLLHHAGLCFIIAPFFYFLYPATANIFNYSINSPFFHVIRIFFFWCLIIHAITTLQKNKITQDCDSIFIYLICTTAFGNFFVCTIGTYIIPDSSFYDICSTFISNTCYIAQAFCWFNILSPNTFPANEEQNMNISFLPGKAEYGFIAINAIASFLLFLFISTL